MAGELKLNIFSGFNDKGVKDAVSSLRKLGDGVKGLGKQLAGGYVGFQGISKSVGFIRSSLDASRDLQRNLAGLTTIFGAATPEMIAFSEAGVQLGMSTAEAAKATTFIGSVMKQSGFAMSDNIPLTKELVKLGSDLAATYGYDVQEALTGMTALFRGEYDPIEKFGVAIKQAQVNAAMAEQGFSKLTGAQKLHAQQLIRMQLLFKATADSQGAFGRMGDTLAVSQMRLAATITNMKTALANSLLQPMTNLVQLMTILTSTIGPALTGMFNSIASVAITAGGNISNFAQQLVGIINQITILFKIAAPIFGALITIISNFGASIFIGIAAFKVIIPLVKAFGFAMDLLKARMVATGLAEVALAAETGLLTAAEAAAVSETIALEAALAATPWGAIAIGIAAGGAALFALGIAAYDAASKIDITAESTKKFEERMNSWGVQFGVISGYGVALESLAGGYGTAAVSSAVATTGVTAYTGSLKQQAAAISAARKEDEFYVKGAKAVAAANYLKASSAIPTAMTPEQQVAKQIAAFKKAMNAISGAISSGTGKAAAKKAAKAISDPFKDMVTSIQSELTRVHDAIVGAFDITSMGSSGGSIGRNIDKFMAKLRQFAGYISQLRAGGLNEGLLTQLAMAGPENGLAAAKAFAGSPQLVSQANAAYGELGTTAKAISGNVVGAQAAPVYNITVSGGVGSGATIGKAVVAAIQAYERQSGPSWRTK